MYYKKKRKEIALKIIEEINKEGRKGNKKEKQRKRPGKKGEE